MDTNLVDSFKFSVNRPPVHSIYLMRYLNFGPVLRGEKKRLVVSSESQSVINHGCTILSPMHGTRAASRANSQQNHVVVCDRLRAKLYHPTHKSLWRRRLSNLTESQAKGESSLTNYFSAWRMRYLPQRSRRDTSMASRSHPSAWPHDLHILSTTFNFSSLPNLGSSRSPTSSKKPSLSRLLSGNCVSAYCRREDTESSNKPVVSGGIAPFVLFVSCCSALT